MHGKIADLDKPTSSATPRLPVDKLHYYTIPTKQLLSSIKPGNWAKNPGRTLYTNLWAWFLHSTHTQGKADNPVQDSTAQQLPLHSYPPCAVQIYLVWGGGIFPVLLFQTLINELSSVSPDLAPDQKGRGRSIVTMDSQEMGAADAALTIHLGWSSLCPSRQTHTHNQAHRTHQESNIHHILAYFLRLS